MLERGEPAPGRPSLLFVHGYWQAAWSWDQYVMPALAGAEQHCVALSLRGHGGSAGKIRGASISDYVEDVASVASRFHMPPVVVGHSMGGFTTQHYLARGHPATAVALVSPVPRQGAWEGTFRVIRRHPGAFLKANLTLDVGAVVERREAARDFLVSPRQPEDFIDGYHDELERASYRTYLDLLFDRPDLSAVHLPAVVIGGTDDGFFSPEEWAKTAKALGAELVMLEGVGHQPMWEGEGTALIHELRRFVEGLS